MTKDPSLEFRILTRIVGKGSGAGYDEGMFPLGMDGERVFFVDADHIEGSGESPLTQNVQVYGFPQESPPTRLDDCMYLGSNWGAPVRSRLLTDDHIFLGSSDDMRINLRDHDTGSLRLYNGWDTPQIYRMVDLGGTILVASSKPGTKYYHGIKFINENSGAIIRDEKIEGNQGESPQVKISGDKRGIIINGNVFGQSYNIVLMNPPFEEPIQIKHLIDWDHKSVQVQRVGDISMILTCEYKLMSGKLHDNESYKALLVDSQGNMVASLEFCEVGDPHFYRKQVKLLENGALLISSTHPDSIQRYAPECKMPLESEEAVLLYFRTPSNGKATWHARIHRSESFFETADMGNQQYLIGTGYGPVVTGSPNPRHYRKSCILLARNLEDGRLAAHLDYGPEDHYVDQVLTQGQEIFMGTRKNELFWLRLANKAI